MSGAESWRPVPGYEGLYDVSDLGRVRSHKRWRVPGRILSPASMPSGYKVASMWRDGKQRTWLVHRLVLLTFVGEPLDGHEALHIDGDNANNRLSNLMWGTHSQNELHKVAHGTHRNASKTHCPSGHPYNEANTYVYKTGRPHRACLECRRLYRLKLKRERRARAQSKVVVP